MSDSVPISRRRLCYCLGVATTGTLAGCSGLTGGDPSAASEDDETESGETAEDTQHPGERTVEQHLSDGGHSWVELEDTSEQVTDTIDSSFLTEHATSFDFQNETVTHQTGSTEGSTFDVDTAYIVLDDDDREGWYTQIGYLDGSEWRDGEGFEGNRFRATAFAGGRANASTLETMFSADVTGYSDVSEDFPDQYRSLLTG